MELNPERAFSPEPGQPDAAWAVTLHGLVDAAVDALGIRLVGVYVHGSAALGGWVPGASDLDVMIVAEPDAPDQALEAIAAATVDVTPAGSPSGTLTPWRQPRDDWRPEPADVSINSVVSDAYR
jgi:nucleotidyltransferase-like protein